MAQLGVAATKIAFADNFALSDKCLEAHAAVAAEQI